MPLDKQDLLQKLRQLEEQARLGIHEYPNGLMLERFRYIAALTKLLRASVQKDIEEDAAPRKVVLVQRSEESR